MNGKTARHEHSLPSLCCPECGGKVVMSTLVADDEARPETAFLFNCENGDFSVSTTEKTLNTIMAEIVVARLGRLR